MPFGPIERALASVFFTLPSNSFGFTGFFASGSFFGGRSVILMAPGGILALKMFDFSEDDADFFCFTATPAGTFLVIMGCCRLKTIIAAIALTSRTKETVIKTGITHRRLAFESSGGIVPRVSGRVKNGSEGADCTSILFKAFRMELNLIILYPNSITVRLRSWAGEPLEAKSGNLSGPFKFSSR